MVEILALATIIAPVTNGVVEGIKRMTGLNKRYLPAVAVFVGLVLGSIAFFLEAELIVRLWAGGISGLASVGLFEIKKNAKEDDE